MQIHDGVKRYVDMPWAGSEMSVSKSTIRLFLPNPVKKALLLLLRLEPSMEQRKEAWFWRSKVTTDKAQKRRYLEDILVNDLWDARARRGACPRPSPGR